MPKTPKRPALDALKRIPNQLQLLLNPPQPPRAPAAPQIPMEQPLQVPRLPVEANWPSTTDQQSLGAISSQSQPSAGSTVGPTQTPRQGMWFTTDAERQSIADQWKRANTSSALQGLIANQFAPPPSYPSTPKFLG